MDEDRISKLLKEADQANPQPSLSPDLGPRVRRRLRRQRAIRTGLSGAAAMLLLAGAVWFTALRPADPQPPMQVVQQIEAEHDMAELEAELARLRFEAELHQQIADRLMQLESDRRRVARARELAARPDPLEEIARQRERAAFSMINHADRLEREFGRHDDAREEYRRTAELFPETAWADVARRRLDLHRQEGWPI